MCLAYASILSTNFLFIGVADCAEVMINRFFVPSCTLDLAFTYCSGSMSAFSLKFNFLNHFLTVLSERLNSVPKFIANRSTVKLFSNLLSYSDLKRSIYTFIICYLFKNTNLIISLQHYFNLIIIFVRFMINPVNTFYTVVI
jgi:hypothetical protein